MKILVTGGAGFIGSHIVDAYIQEGHEVIVVDDLSTGNPDNINPAARFYLLDIRSKEMERLIQMEKPDIINHQAAQISVPLSTQDPAFDAHVNILGTINVLKAGADYGVKRFIFASTGGAIYGNSEGKVLSEETQPAPESPYATSKLAAEKYIELLSKGKFSYAILRYGNVYGPRQIPHGEAGVVAIFSLKIIAGEPITIYTYPDMKRGMVRDYVFVKDVAKANLLATFGDDNLTVNISTGKGTDTLALLETLMKVAGKKVRYRFDPPRPGDIRYSILSCESARKLLGWSPEFSLEEGLRKTYNYFLNRY